MSLHSVLVLIREPGNKASPGLILCTVAHQGSWGTRLYMWQSRVEIEDYSALAKNELVMLIEALGRPQLFAEVLALIVA